MNITLGILAAICAVFCLAADGWAAVVFGILAIIAGVARFVPEREKIDA